MRKRFANRIGQRLIALVAALTVAIGCAAVFIGCSDKTDSPPPAVAAEIALDAAEKTAYVGDTFRLAATVKNTSDPVSWYSSNAEVAAVSTDGTVTVFSVGTANISAVVGGAQAKCVVTAVNSPYPLLEVSLASSIVYLGHPRTVSANVSFNGQNIEADVTYVVDNETIASVDESGVITGKAEGKTTVRVNAAVNGTQLSRTVDITVKQLTFFYMNERLDVSFEDDIFADDYPHSAKVNATGYSNGAEIDLSQIAWSVEDESVATVSDDGVITGVSEGKTVLTATVGGTQEKCEINVRAQQRRVTVNDGTDVTFNAHHDWTFGIECTASSELGEVGGRAPQGNAFKKAALAPCTCGGNHGGLDGGDSSVDIYVNFDKSFNELNALLSAGYDKLVLPVYMEFNGEHAEGDDSRMILGPGRQHLTWGPSGEVTDGKYRDDQFVAYLHNKSWNDIEFDLKFIVDYLTANKGGSASSLGLKMPWWTRTGEWTAPNRKVSTTFYFDSMYVTRGTSLHTGGYDDVRNTADMSPYCYGVDVGGDWRDQKADAQYIKFSAIDASGKKYVTFDCNTADNTRSGNTVVLSKWSYQSMKESYKNYFTLLKSKGYDAVRYRLYLKTQDTVSFTAVSSSGEGVAEAGNTAVTLNKNGWTDIDVPIDTLIARMSAGGQCAIMSFAVTTESTNAFSVYLGEIKAVKTA